MFVLWSQYAHDYVRNADNTLWEFETYEEADTIASQYNAEDAEGWRAQGYAVKKGECYQVQNLEVVRSPVSKSQVCETCGEGAQYGRYCSSSFHQCMACTWRSGELVTACRGCLEEQKLRITLPDISEPKQGSPLDYTKVASEFVATLLTDGNGASVRLSSIRKLSELLHRQVEQGRAWESACVKGLKESQERLTAEIKLLQGVVKAADEILAKFGDEDKGRFDRLRTALDDWWGRAP